MRPATTPGPAGATPGPAGRTPGAAGTTPGPAETAPLRLRRPLLRDRVALRDGIRAPHPLRGSPSTHPENHATPVPQNVKKVLPWEFFTHSLEKVRS